MVPLSAKENVIATANRLSGEVSQHRPVESPIKLPNEDAVLNDFEQSLLNAPTSTDTVLAYHAAVLERKAFARAEAIFREVLKRHPHNKRLHFLLIDLICRQQDFHGAMPEIEAAIVDFGIDDGMLKAALVVRARVGPHAGRGDGVSLCMIVKNEEEHLARCLHSAKPIVDEIIVVDTGSTDRSSVIARAFGAKVFDQPWDNDFAKARNFSLSQAAGHWILVLDADEAISAKDHALFREIVHDRVGPPAAYSVQTRNYTFHVNTVGWRSNAGEYGEQEAGAGWFPSEKVRLFPNNPGVRFSYAIHEVVEPSLRKSSIPIRKCGVQVHHYGKLKEDLTQQKTKAYFEIERRKLRESANKPASLRELAIQAAQLGQHAESIDLWRQFLSCHPDSAEAHVNLGAAYWQLGLYDDAVRSAETAMGYAPLMKEAHFNLAMAELHRGDAPRAVAVLEPLLLREPDYLHARFLLSAAYACGADHERCIDTLQPMRATALGPVLSVSFLELAKRLLAAGQREYGLGLLEVAVRSGFSDPELSAFAEQQFAEQSPHA